MSVDVFLSLGSNLDSAHGGPEANLAWALGRLAELPGVVVAAASSVYRTEPQGLKNQPWFHNQAARLAVDGSWTPQGLLAALKDIEQALGRAAGERFGPRVLDLDLLTFGDAVLDTPELTLPHPRMRARAFVLVPLRELDPDRIFPGGWTPAQALAEIPHRQDGRTIHQP